MRLHKLIIAAVCLLAAATQAEAKKDYVISRDVLMDKIRGGWAGQIIGCSYGGPTEFKYATFIDKNVDIPWDAHAIKYWYDNVPGLYDDVYMDLTFVDVFAKEGLDAPLESFAKAFANAGYQLWHANLKARYNILYGGILATMLGYSGIPEYWKAPLYEVADRNFKYTDISFNKASELSFDQALQVIERNGGKVGPDKVTIKREAPVAVRFEQGFTGHYPYKYFDVRKSVTKAGVAPFEGIGCVVKGNPQLPKDYQPHGYVAEIDVYLDGEFDKTVLIPVDGPAVPAEFYAKYNLPAGKHTVELKWKNKGDEPADLIFRTVLAYSDHQVKTEHK